MSWAIDLVLITALPMVFLIFAWLALFVAGYALPLDWPALYAIGAWAAVWHAAFFAAAVRQIREREQAPVKGVRTP